ncbi:helix-turn-helix domain-containing protein [[Haemophilus] felis]|uniref:Transcriptional regulator n=1 Tax=[Haemophilus] felis TaxID=123822 RepID=A0A1T0B5P0_9PAST|nr:helix-turn-helix domain-containing protein [[Haemophilus] felis]NBI41132.1 helix-turn-helix domain-containing protein [[Haemophilus] felis]NBI43001.1 helix-turn-helix domain-containing protein [[Haemophilus] felis]OOS05239.1 transcriptional regulator [[Haemophilus] felis]
MDNELFDDLLTSAKQIVAIEKGELVLESDKIKTFAIPNVKHIRQNVNLKQNEFAKLLGVSTALVQSWELQRRIPNGPALKLLTMLEHQPKLIDTLKLL